jgi:hypothetical protein
MKKIIAIVLLLNAIQGNAQKSFERGTNVISAGADLGVYDYVSKINSSSLSSTSKAANKSLSLQYERGIRNWLGFGAKVQMVDYFTKKDSILGNKPSVKSFDGIIFLNFHFARTNRFDMLAGFNLGYSQINWEARDASITEANGGGSVLDFHIQPRFYFGNHVGMFVNLSYLNYNYTNIDFTNSTSQANDVLDLKGGGVNFGLGLQAKF